MIVLKLQQLYHANSTKKPPASAAELDNQPKIQ